MSDEPTRAELEALKDALENAARKPTPSDVPIPFTEKGVQRVGRIIADVATNLERPRAKKSK